MLVLLKLALDTRCGYYIYNLLCLADIGTGYSVLLILVLDTRCGYCIYIEPPVPLQVNLHGHRKHPLHSSACQLILINITTSSSYSRVAKYQMFYTKQIFPTQVYDKKICWQFYLSLPTNLDKHYNLVFSYSSSSLLKWNGYRMDVRI